MDNLAITGTDRTPEIEFDFAGHRLKISGESYPEDATSFYDPVLETLETYLGALGDGQCHMDFVFIYFNSSSARAVMTIFQLLEDAAENGATISATWHYDDEDDTMQEMGEEFGEDLEHVRFELAVAAG